MNLDYYEKSSIPDASAGNWVDRFAPAPLKPWLRLARVDRPIGVWLLLWPCWWSTALAARASQDLPSLRVLALFALGAFAMRSAGCVYNDIIDRDIDTQVARTRLRPLATGEISVKWAVVYLLAFCIIGLFVLLSFNPFAIALGFASVGIVLIYPLMKRVTFWPQAVLGLAFSWGALMGWAVATSSLTLVPIVLYAASVAWTIAYDTIYGHQDTEDDAIVGVKSTALRFAGQTRVWLAFFFALAIAGIAFSGWLVGAGMPFFVLMLVAAGHATWQVATLDTSSPANCLRRFRSNRGFGAIVFAALMLDVLMSATA